MAEEKNTEAKGSAKTILKMAIGGLLIVLGLLAVIVWWKDLFTMVRGFLGLFLIMAGAIVIAIAKE